MNANEITATNFFKLGFLIKDAKRWHYRDAMKRGVVFPSNAAQAKFMMQKGYCFDCLGKQDVDAIEEVMKEFGDGILECKYQYTKSKAFVRLTNHWVFFNALKRKYNL